MKGKALSELWRRDCDWERVRERLERIVHNPKARDADAIAAASVLLDRAWGKPLTSHELHVTGETLAEPASFEHLSFERRRAILAELRGDVAESRVSNPSPPGENPNDVNAVDANRTGETS